MLNLPRPTWDEFTNDWGAKWKPGEHVFIYGETGSGKTDLAFRLLNVAKYGVAFVTKPRDPIFKSSLTRGYRSIHSWPPRNVNSVRDHHFLLSAKPERKLPDEIEAQRKLFPDAFNEIYTDGGWTVLFDESLHLTESLRMGTHLKNFAYLARSNNLTGIYCTQRPRTIPVVIPQSCKYAFIARTRRDDDRKVLGELGYDPKELSRMLQGLRDNHEFLFVDPQGDFPLQIVNTHK